MKMIAHQAPGVNLPLRFFTGLRQRRQKPPAIQRIAKNILPAVPTVHHMVDRSGKLAAHRARHGRQPLTFPTQL
jgi:hypothetical protein